jgi:ribonuclease HI
MTWLRLNKYKTAPEEGTLLPQHLHDLYEDFKATGLASCLLDEIPRVTNDLVLDVSISDGFNFDIPSAQDVSIYTDGSKIDKEGAWGTGAGYVIMLHDQEIASRWITLCYTKSVFMAEVTPITFSLRTLKEKLEDGTIPHTATTTVYSDSQSALKALSSTYIHTQTVLDCVQTIKALPTRHRLKFAWVKAHAGNAGNEKADRLAKEGARRPRPVEGPGPFHGRHNRRERHGLRPPGADRGKGRSLSHSRLKLPPCSV